MPEKKREEYVRVLDVLPQGHPEDDRPAYQKDPITQVVGEDGFVLLEVVPKEDANPKLAGRLYVGSDERDVVDHVKRRVGYEDLTHTGQAELQGVVEDIVEDREDYFVKWFNQAQPISTRMHMLELLQGIGKKLQRSILDERRRGDFESFEDLEERVSGLHNPKRLVAKRIVQEIKDEDCKYYAFTRAPASRDR